MPQCNCNCWLIYFEASFNSFSCSSIEEILLHFYFKTFGTEMNHYLRWPPLTIWSDFQKVHYSPFSGVLTNPPTLLWSSRFGVGEVMRVRMCREDGLLWAPVERPPCLLHLSARRISACVLDTGWFLHDSCSSLNFLELAHVCFYWPPDLLNLTPYLCPMTCQRALLHFSRNLLE